MTTLSRILVVDDDNAIATVLSRVLTNEKYEITISESGDAARKILNKTEFDLVITDLRMPGTMDGVDLFRWIKEHQPTTDVILISGNPSLESALESFRFGAWDFLIKPIDLNHLKASVRRCLARRRAVVDAENPEQLREALMLLAREINVLGSVRSTLGRYVSKDVVDVVLGSSQTGPQKGERRRVSILFADIRSFTSFAEDQNPEFVFKRLNDLFESWVEVVTKYGGTIDKFTGDGLMALFNAPRKLKDHEYNAVSCAVEMMQKSKEWSLDLEAGIGINTGDAMVGSVGSSTRSEFTAIGSAVNLASRLESRAAPGQILLGPETAKAIHGKIPCSFYLPMKINGLSEAIPVFEVRTADREIAG